MKKGGINLGKLTNGQDGWRIADELLQARQYKQVDELLHKVQVTGERTGDAILTDILTAARVICLALVTNQVEVERHRQAYEDADQREQTLKQQLQAIFDLVSEREPSAPREKRNELSRDLTTETGLSPRGVPEPVERPSFWQRIQSLLGRRPIPQVPGWEPATARVQQLARPTVEEAEGVAAVIPQSEPEASPESQGEKVPPIPIEKAEAVADSISEREPEVAPVSPVAQEKQEEQVSPSLVIYCMGAFRVYQNDQLIIDWVSLKGQCIFKYLIAHRGKPITKDVLMDVFWPDADPEAARRNLHQAVYCLRQTLRQGQPDFQHIQFENDCYLLNPDMDVWLDCEEFEKHVQTGRRLEANDQLTDAIVEYGIAEGLYQGDFLEADLYEDWSKVQRDQIRNIYLDIVNRLSEYYVQQGEYTPAMVLCRKILVQDNCYEEAHRRLMQCYLAQGQRYLAVRQYQTCVETLREELDLAPSEETMTLYRHIATIA